MTDIVKVFREGGGDGSNFVGHLFVRKCEGGSKVQGADGVSHMCWMVLTGGRGALEEGRLLTEPSTLKGEETIEMILTPAMRPLRGRAGT